MKTISCECAAQHRPLKPSEARVLVLRVLTEERVSPWPPNDAIAFYATEMVERSVAASP
ncbi:MAG: hypothetical protein JO029_05955 [Candidatus Eremiobacteraeota bacterium]|nr:hypothetical protein [Candidatus Eremiobacteraeota bacterium]